MAGRTAISQRRVRLTVAYDGTRYAGWQRQTNAVSVQQVIEECLTDLLRSPVRVLAAGRTDAGVHALGQVIAFDARFTIPVARLPLALNARLPEDIRVSAAAIASAGFHPRYDASSRLYRYLIDDRKTASVLHRHMAWHVRDGRLDIESMNEASQCLLGEHDFTAFRAAGGAVGSPVRRVLRADWRRTQGFVRFTIEANSFVYRMVRNLVGTIVPVGLGRSRATEVENILRGRDRTRAGPTAPPHGLCLVRVRY